MKKIIYFAIFILISVSLFADWDPGDPAKWIQLPDESGYDVNFTDNIPPNDMLLADDWQCEITNYVDEVHLWISFREDIIPEDPTGYFGIEYVHLSIHSDMPEGPHGYSQPDQLLWEKDIYPPDFTVRPYGVGPQGWYDPFQLQHLIIEGDHSNYYQINICCGFNSFLQEGTPTTPVIYWLDACIKMKDEFEFAQIGWKSSLDHWNDNAVYWNPFLPGWAPLNDPLLHEPYETQFDLAFVLNGHDVPCPVDLSSFYATYIAGIPTLYWTTQSEDDNDYWNIYRGNNNEFDQASLINDGEPVVGQGTTQYPTDYVFADETPVVQSSTYWYWLESVSTDGETEVHEPITLFIPGEDAPILPEIYGLYQNYPNPFNPSTLINFALEEESDIQLIIYTVKGEKIKTIFKGHIFADEISSAVWDGNDKNGKQVSSGVYFYKLITESKVYSMKMLLVK